MANITKISAKTNTAASATTPSAPTKSTKNQKTSKSARKCPARLPAPLRWLIAPFRGLARYLADAWGELRQVHWPTRKATWQMVLAIFLYVALFIIFIMIADAAFTALFKLIIK